MRAAVRRFGDIAITCKSRMGREVRGNVDREAGIAGDPAVIITHMLGEIAENFRKLRANETLLNLANPMKGYWPLS